VGDPGPADPGAIPSIWPVSPSTGFVTREFSEGAGVVSNGHPGVDIAAPQGTLVVTTGDGTVAYASEDEVMGNLLAVDHFGAFLTRYGHNDQFLVRVGDRVRKGQPIALVGSSGQSNSPHLHYEVWQDGRPRDPRRFLPR
jgi:murein DD-endopeptidase MepM/ murein hydrolase activator NlpD